MSLVVVTGAKLMCTFGTTPATFNATGTPSIMAGGKPVGTITDGAGMVNITSCGMCSSLANPAVAAATAAALGVLTPQPCVPVTTGTWLPNGTMVLAGNKPCLTQESKCICSYGGTISVVTPGQTTVLTT
ncbi:MAG: DUF4280 domain-containing protein [Lachnospiraceae bacterium]|nr:DUF4280 domain-containing protein [Lachnospiraceae bacterium]